MSRFVSISFSRVGSASIAGGSPALFSKWMLFSLAVCATSSRTSRIIRDGSTRSDFIVRTPCSRRAVLSSREIRSLRRSLRSYTLCKISFISGDRLVADFSSNTVCKPHLMAFTGLRSSWAAMNKNSSFNRWIFFSFSSSCLCAFSSSCVRRRTSSSRPV
ncbi:MAG: hypothetical protein G01um101429_667 [Parcubacteria group bacterium Gr01-1014_29]|nr:MAG: hypothetical protein G01um101429_667 [Parcubacteria group bacterium Gr01-1014_29]